VTCFESLRSRRHDTRAILYAFNLIELVGNDLRREGLEGRRSGRRDSRYVSGRSKHWIKAKNPTSAAVAARPKRIGDDDAHS
jgi:ATP-dependent DNA ligase